MGAAEIRMQPGKQEQAAACAADILIYGGAAGAGKTFWEICEPLRWVHLPGFGAIFFRRLSTMLTGPGSAFEEAKGLYPAFGARMREGNTLDARFKIKGSNRNAIIEFAHLQYEKDLDNHQSKQYGLIIFDELTQFTENQFWYLVSRNRTMCAMKPYIRAGCNPDPDSWVRTLIDWWIGEDGYPIESRSGVIRWFVRANDDLVWFDSQGEASMFALKHFPIKKDRPRPKSFTFIAASLDDNPELEKANPDYRSNLLALPKVEREQLLGGNWNIKRGAGTYFNRNWVNKITALPTDLVEVWRGWDKAATEPSADNPDPDYTASVLIGRRRNGRIVVLHAEHFRMRPDGVQKRMLSTAQRDGHSVKIALWQDPGAAGKADVVHDVKNLLGYVTHTEVAKENKETYFLPFSAQCEAGNVDVLCDGTWDHSSYFYELENFAGAKAPGKKDWVDATSGAFLRISSSNLSAFAVLSRWRKQ